MLLSLACAIIFMERQGAKQVISWKEKENRQLVLKSIEIAVNIGKLGALSR